MIHRMELQNFEKLIDRLRSQIETQLVPHEGHSLVLPCQQVFQQQKHNGHAISVKPPLNHCRHQRHMHCAVFHHRGDDGIQLREADDALPGLQPHAIKSRDGCGHGDPQSVSPDLRLVQSHQRALETEDDEACDVQVEFRTDTLGQAGHPLQLALRGEVSDVVPQTATPQAPAGLAHELHELLRRQGHDPIARVRTFAAMLLRAPLL
mmetsp:Transcript_56320/g.161632  ORF Transcript_56320/g.161632 Transcript_56320/m.161632 type:complete len:207 (+) Transcript_56320:1179-1799(+)